VSIVNGRATRFRDERGGVIVLVALLMPFILGLLALALDVGGWFEHRRHLQVQADAAALAGGGLFGNCLTQSSGFVQTAMEAQAVKYGRTLNPQVGGISGQGTIAFAYQSSTFPKPGPPTDPDVVDGKAACDAGMFDVKATESDIPNFFALSPLATVHAHARVELRAVNQQKGLLPVAVPDVRFTYAYATFIDESTGAPLAGCPGGCTEELVKTGTAGGLQLWSSTSPLSVPISVARIGVRLRLVQVPDPNAACGQLYVECYDAGSANGVVFVRGWSGSGTVAKDAWLLPGTDCSPDAYFTIANCGAGIQAEIDFGDHDPSGAQVWASVDGGGKYPLTHGSGNAWTRTSGLPISGAGPHDVSLSWSWEQTSGTWHDYTCSSGGGNRCTDGGSFGNVQRSFRAFVELSGPVKLVQVFEPGVSTSGGNSFEQGSTHTLGVTIGTTGNLQVQSQVGTPPLVELRVAGGSLNQSIDCDPDQSNIRSEIQNGCGPAYEINPGTSCPAYNALWSTPQPWNCVKTQTGGSVGQVEQGLKDRILGGSNTCTAPINWGKPEFSERDPRIIPLIITPFGSFNGSGNDIVPVIDFGAFYVMGWDGDPCPGAAPVPKKGFVSGYFIKYIPSTPRGAGDSQCYLTDPSQITPCVPVMTR
jgi:hypothetical protein